MACDTDRLIRKALENGLGRGQFRLTRIERLDSHLVGHAFKYHEASRHILGVYPYRIGFVDARGESRSADVMLKAKPDQSSIIRVYQGLLDQSGIKLEADLTHLLRHSDYWTPNLKEAVLFRDFEQPLKPYLPRSFGVYIDRATSYTLRLEERLPAGSVILDPDDDTTEHWQSGFPAITLKGLADIHARFCNRYQPLLDTSYFFVCDKQVMLQARELWQALFDVLRDAYGGLMNAEHARRHEGILATLGDWYARADGQPKTLLYGDVDPQNLAFAKTEDGFQLSLFDWERAAIGLPQRDLAEHLIYTLPVGFGKQQAVDEIEAYRRLFTAKSGADIGESAFYQGLVWMLYDLIINRLPLMMIVKKVAGKRRHSANGYVNAHALVRYLS